VRVVLEEQVVFPRIEQEPGRVIDLAAVRGEMELRPAPLTIEILRALDGVGLNDGLERGGLLRQRVGLEHEPLAMKRHESSSAQHCGAACASSL
jgi:hypothetical protein